VKYPAVTRILNVTHRRTEMNPMFLTPADDDAVDMDEASKSEITEDVEIEDEADAEPDSDIEDDDDIEDVDDPTEKELDE